MNAGDRRSVTQARVSRRNPGAPDACISGEPAAWGLPVLLLCFGLAGILQLSMDPKPGKPVAAIFPPWWNAPQAFKRVAKAGGVIVRTGAWPGIVITTSPDSGFSTRLREAGAWLVIDPLIAGGCIQSHGRSN